MLFMAASARALRQAYRDRTQPAAFDQAKPALPARFGVGRVHRRRRAGTACTLRTIAWASACADATAMSLP